MSKKSNWEDRFDEWTKLALTPGFRVLDIGAGLRMDPSRGNVIDPSHAWMRSLAEKATVHVMDPVDTYHPDIVGDIANIPCENASYDAVVCLSVLEHVEFPRKGVEEIYRILKPGGILFGHVPFLYPYHAMPGYYGDFFRFTDEGVRSLCRDFSSVEIVPVRGPLESVFHLFPNSIAHKGMNAVGKWIDGFRHGSGKQASGFQFLAKK